jgi:hypothetical protein
MSAYQPVVSSPHLQAADQPRLPREQVKFWRAQDVGNLDLLRATFITHTFARHTHAGYAIGVIEQGGETFWYRGARHIAPAGSIVLIDPDEVHTGEAISATGWHYRMLYPEVALVRGAAEQLAGHHVGTPSFPEPVVCDPEARASLQALHTTLETSVSTLARETHLLLALRQLLARHAVIGLPGTAPSHEPGAVARVRRYLGSITRRIPRSVIWQRSPASVPTICCASSAVRPSFHHTPT